MLQSMLSDDICPLSQEIFRICWVQGKPWLSAPGVGFVVFSGSAQILGWAKGTDWNEGSSVECMPGICHRSKYKEQTRYLSSISVSEAKRRG